MLQTSSILAPPADTRHVIIETNKTTARIFPEVPDCECAEFWDRMERLIQLNKQLISIGGSDLPGPVKALQRLPVRVCLALCLSV